MKKEDLYEGFGTLNDNVLSRSEKEEGMMKKRTTRKIIKIGTLAACLIAAIVLGVFVIDSNKTPDTENDVADNNVATSTSVDVAPMVYVNDTLFKKSLEEVYYEEMLQEFVYVGTIESDVISSQSSSDGVPKENLQANTPIVGSEVYQYGDNVVIKINGIYWLYEVEGVANNSADWNSLSEEEKMQLDPMYNPN